MFTVLIALHVLGMLLMAAFLLYGTGFAEALPTAGLRHHLLFTAAVLAWEPAILVMVTLLAVSWAAGNLEGRFS